MKKQAILIQCHNKPEQINEIINYLPKEMFDIYIHVDRKSSIISDIVHKENTFFVKNRIDVRWGRFSQVEATISLINEIKNPLNYSYCHLISGNDFVIKPISWIVKTFSENNDKQYIESNYLDGTSTWSWGGLDRFQCYYPQWMIQRPKNKIMKIIRVCYREFIMRTKIFKRKNMPVSRFYGGSSWWSLTGEMIDWIKKYVTSTPEYYSYFKHGVCIDEVFFSTLVRYSPYKDKITNNHMRFMKWNEPGNVSGGPAILSEKDINNMVKSPYVFGRKFTDVKTIRKLIHDLDQDEILNTQ